MKKNIFKTDKRFDLGIALVREAASVLKKNRHAPKITESFRHDTKLEQDIQSEKIIVSGITKNFPGDGFLSEEKSRKNSDSGYTWIIDPLDGTVNYSRGLPHCCISVACKGKDVSFGIVYDFFRDEMFTAENGQGALLNGEKISVSKTSQLKEAVICIGIMKEDEDVMHGISIFTELAAKAKKVRIMGAAALDLCYAASGRTDFFVETGLKEWDTAAGSVIVKEAGGEYGDFYVGKNRIVFAANKNLRTKKLLKIFSDMLSKKD